MGGPREGGDQEPADWVQAHRALRWTITGWSKGVRDTIEMYSTGRPHIEYASDEAGAKPGEPYIIVADRVRLKGNDRLWAGGKVTIDRSDFSARADSLRLDTGKGNDGTLVGGSPIMRGLGRDSFSLTGRRLDLKLNRREITYVVAKGNGHAVSKEWDLVADTIGLDIKSRKLEQTLAWGDSIRPNATSPSYAMRADSLALDTPVSNSRKSGGLAPRGWAVRSTPRPSSATGCGVTPWSPSSCSEIRPGPSTALSRIVARKGAQSLSSRSHPKHPDRPAINYARGDVIVMTMKQGLKSGVDRVDIRGQVDGIQLEAADVLRRRTRPKPGPTHSRGAPESPMTAPEWVAALGDRDPSVPIGLAAIVRAAGPTDSIAFSDLVHSYREAYLACYQQIGEADQEVSGDDVRHHLNSRCCRASPPRVGSWTRPRAIGRRCGPGWPGGGRRRQNGKRSMTHC